MSRPGVVAPANAAKSIVAMDGSYGATDCMIWLDDPLLVAVDPAGVDGEQEREGLGRGDKTDKRGFRLGARVWGW